MLRIRFEAIFVDKVTGSFGEWFVVVVTLFRFQASLEVTIRSTIQRMLKSVKDVRTEAFGLNLLYLPFILFTTLPTRAHIDVWVQASRTTNGVCSSLLVPLRLEAGSFDGSYPVVQTCRRQKLSIFVLRVHRSTSSPVGRWAAVTYRDFVAEHAVRL